MVSQNTSRDRLLTAAVREFAARGFDGAKVDRIAAKARVNKAMLYYHFHHKAALYEEILRDMFGAMAAAVTAVHAAGGDPRDRVRRWIHAVAAEAAARPDFPAIWLREMAEGGRHLGDATFLDLRTVVSTLGAILADGQRAGLFRDVNPFILQLSIVAPLLLFSASAPVRQRFAHLLPPQIAHASRESLIEHLEAATFAALAPEATALTTPRKAPAVRLARRSRS